MGRNDDGWIVQDGFIREGPWAGLLRMLCVIWIEGTEVCEALWEGQWTELRDPDFRNLESWGRAFWVRLYMVSVGNSKQVSNWNKIVFICLSVHQRTLNALYVPGVRWWSVKAKKIQSNTLDFNRLYSIGRKVRNNHKGQILNGLKCQAKVFLFPILLFQKLIVFIPPTKCFFGFFLTPILLAMYVTYISFICGLAWDPSHIYSIALFPPKYILDL